jgi:RNA polymerase sigma-70 factor (ECF subfamily)
VFGFARPLEVEPLEDVDGQQHLWELRAALATELAAREARARSGAWARTGASAERVKAAHDLWNERFATEETRYARRLMREAIDEAADLVQRAFVKGFRKLSSCREPDRVGAWLFRIVANLCKDHVRSPRREDVSMTVVGGALRSTADPSSDAEGSEIRTKVWGALDTLTPEQREAFVLKHVEGRSYEEIAAVMDLSVASLKMRVHRAREALRGLLEEYA